METQQLLLVGRRAFCGAPSFKKGMKRERQFFFFSSLSFVEDKKALFFNDQFFAQNRSSSDDSVISLCLLLLYFTIKHRCKNEATINTDGGGSDAQRSDRGPVHRNLFRGREQQQQLVLEHGRPGGFTDAWIFVEEANEKGAKNEK